MAFGDDASGVENLAPRGAKSWRRRPPETSLIVLNAHIRRQARRVRIIGRGKVDPVT